METTSADDAPQALLCLSTAAEQQNNYDIILSDLHMPDMDGFAFAKQINNMPSIASTPRLLLSSGGLPTKNKLIEMGFSQSLLKPIRRTQLFNAIAATLNYIEEKTIIPTEDSKALANYSHKKVLVVEDNKTNQIVILGMLKKLQIIPDLEENGQHALDRIAHNNYDLVLMDCQMPVLDGYEATRKLRDKEATHHSPRVPIIALTAHAAIGEREKCLAAGMDDYLTKPLSKVSLRKILHHWLGESVIVEKEPTTQQHPLQNIVTNTNCWDKSAALKLIDNDEEILTDMIDIFMSGISEFLSDLDNAITQNDLSSLANVAHTIKGIAGQLCAEHLTTLASDLEIDARAENAVDFNALVKNISQAMNDLTDELK